jgi:hypothetical protein
MAKLISKKKLIPMLIEQGFITDAKSVNYEAYSSKVYAYVRMADLETRAKLEAFLRTQGIEFNPAYARASHLIKHTSPISEVRVSYFKAHHWDE